MKIDAIDHIVLTVKDVDATCEFYARTLGMEPVTFAGGRRALAFGSQKINLHPHGREFEPKAGRPTPGSADVCFVTPVPLPDVIAHLAPAASSLSRAPSRARARAGRSNPSTSAIQTTTW